MKNLVNVSIVSLLLTLSACTSVKLVGKVNMVSDRNIESKNEYVLLKNYMGASNKELKKSRSTSVEDAIDQTVRNTAGGEFLKNAKIYLVNGSYFAIEGDVWGIASNQNFRGWKVGDKVQWKAALGKTATGIITELKDASNASVRQDADGKVKDVIYDKLSKIE